MFLLLAAFWLGRRARCRAGRVLAGVLGGVAVAALIVGGGLVWYTHRPLPDPVTAQPLYQGVTYTRALRQEPRPQVIHVIRVDLTAPGIAFLVTPPDPAAGHDMPASLTSHFLAAFDLQIAINANYFTPWWSNAPWDYYPAVGDPVTVSGAAVSQGTAYGTEAAAWTPLAITADNRVTVGWEAAPDDPANLVSGQLLLHDGALPPESVDADPYFGSPQPRTAVGVDAAGATLILLVVDGRQPGYSEGVTLRELAALMVDYGGDDAVNLDGGGSVTLVRQGPDGAPVLLNSPIDNRIPGRERPVANHLGVRALPLD